MNPANAGQDRPQPGSVTFDARRPWLSHLRPELDGALAASQAGLSVASALAGARSAPADADGGPHFVSQSALPTGEAYEAFIRRTAQVPTRNNLHDYFNGLVWLALPALKRRLNALQAAEIALRGVGAVRGRVRDALTLFDESGALLQAPPALLAALRSRDWPALFITHRRLGRSPPGDHRPRPAGKVGHRPAQGPDRPGAAGRPAGAGRRRLGRQALCALAGAGHAGLVAGQ